MSSPRYDWWPYVKGMIRRYPALETEREALGKLRGVARREYQAVAAAIQATQGLPNGAARLAVIQYVFWDGRPGRKLLAQAADHVHYSYRTVCRFHRDFIRLVAVNFGLLDAPRRKRHS